MFRFSVFLIACAAATLAASAAEVRLRSAAVCGGSVARVSDVAEVFGADQRIATALAEIPLCPAPAAGQSKILSQEDIRQLLDLSGVERKSATVTGSETVTITREAAPRANPATRQPLIASGVRQAVFEIEPESKTNSRLVRPATLESAASGEAKPIKTAPLIEKGESLTVHARTAGVRITTAGKAIDAGSLGDTIRVELLDTKQKVIARVVSPQTVEITTEANTAQTASQK